jgi:hypothetical protein
MELLRRHEVEFSKEYLWDCAHNDHGGFNHFVVGRMAGWLNPWVGAGVGRCPPRGANPRLPTGTTSWYARSEEEPRSGS